MPNFVRQALIGLGLVLVGLPVQAQPDTLRTVPVVQTTAPPSGMARVRQRIAQIRGQATPQIIVVPVAVPTPGAPQSTAAPAVTSADLDRLYDALLATERRLGSRLLLLDAANRRLIASEDTPVATDSTSSTPLPPVELGNPVYLPIPMPADGLSRGELVALLDSLLDARGFTERVPPPPREPTVAIVEKSLLETGLFRAANVLFEFDRSTLLPASLPTLNAVGEVLTKYPDLRLEIAGHTDRIGSDAYNETLSQARAEAVRTYLLGRFPQLMPGRLTAVGYGEQRPISDDLSETGRALNRRVEFVVREGGN